VTEGPRARRTQRDVAVVTYNVVLTIVRHTASPRVAFARRAVRRSPHLGDAGVESDDDEGPNGSSQSSEHRCQEDRLQ
jgi:hypothetical protein